MLAVENISRDPFPVSIFENAGLFVCFLVAENLLSIVTGSSSCGES